MKSKQEVIQEAYGEYWSEVEKDIIQECYICFINERSTLVAWNDLLMIAHKTDNHLYMPASLKGIETNNGWTRIESEEDLPKLAGYDFKRKYFTVVDGKIRDDVMFNVVFGEWRTVKGCKITKMDVTHYMDINIPPLPIF